jgi:SAM-dependent methyltransferase
VSAGPSSVRCAACGGGDLAPALRVGGDAGERGLIPTTDRFGVALSDIVRCRACGHGQLDRPPDPGALSTAYAEAASEDYVGEEAGQRATAARVLAEVERYRPPGRLLDLGCWVGFLLAEGRDRGWEPHGVEPSAFASEWARAELGLDVRTAELDAVPFEGPFDAAVMADVIEHLLDPGEALDRVRPLLAERGVLALTLPDAGSRLARAMGRRWWSVLPTHVQYFTRASIAVLLRSRGFEVLSIGTHPKAFTVRYYLERIGGYRPRLSRGLVAAAERAGIAERIWAPDFRDRMLVLAARSR